MNIKRIHFIKLLSERLSAFPIVAILGPRQCGKTTLAKQFISDSVTSNTLFFDCEDPRDLDKLENPMFLLENHQGLIVIDEIQRRPDLFPLLRVLSDQSAQRQFLILGSASQDLIAQSSETLAGRISYIELTGFSLNELTPDDDFKLWLRGGFPLAFLAANNNLSAQWREDFIRTFLERDIPNLGIKIPSRMLRRFWMMLSHYHGRTVNFSELGRSLNISDTTVKRYLDLLTGTFMIRQLSPWYYNTQKRLVKSPKIYFRDSGIMHSLLSVSSKDELLHHPKLGASWEGFALEQIINLLNIREEDVFFWAVHTGAELDLVFQRKGQLWGVEFKFSQRPSITPSMRSALKELQLEHLWVVHPGEGFYQIDEKISSSGLRNIHESFAWLL